MYYFYILYSLKDGKLYKGVTQDVGDRYLKHNMGGTTSTRYRRPLVLIYIRFEALVHQILSSYSALNLVRQSQLPRSLPVHTGPCLGQLTTKESVWTDPVAYLGSVSRGEA